MFHIDPVILRAALIAAVIILLVIKWELGQMK